MYALEGTEGFAQTDTMLGLGLARFRLAYIKTFRVILRAKRDIEDTDINGSLNAHSKCILFDHYLSFYARTLLRLLQLSKKRKSYVKVSPPQVI